MVNAKQLLRALGKLERRIKAKLRSVVRRGTLAKITTDGARQTVQTKGLADDVRDDVEYFEPYGFTSGAPAGSECVVLNVGADTSHGIAIMAGGREYRIAGVGEGEVAVYHRDGAAAVFRNDGSVEIYGSQSQPVRLGPAGGPPHLPVARETDPVMAAPDFQTWITAVTSAVATMAAAFNVAAPVVGAPGTIPAPTIADLVAPTDFGLIEAGGEGSEST